MAPIDLARFIDRVRRLNAPLRPGVVVEELRAGWASARPGMVPGDVPSASRDLVQWLTTETPITADDADEAVRFFRRWNRPSGFAWLAPWAWHDGIERAMRDRGFTPFPHVEYATFERAADAPFGPEIATRGTGLDLRRFEIPPAGDADVEAVLDSFVPWFSAEGVAATKRVLREGRGEVWLAFHENAPVAMSLLTVERPFGYLWAAGTHPAHRGRGAQAALIVARVRRARELGATSCTVETNSAVPISWRNIERAGFAVRVLWRVYRWSDPGVSA